MVDKQQKKLRPFIQVGEASYYANGDASLEWFPSKLQNFHVLISRIR